MNLSELALSANSLIQAFVAVLYGAAGLAAFRWLLPRLSPPTKRLAIVFFVAQLLMLGIALIIEPSGKIERWLWDIDGERNIPATLAAIQLAMVGGVALIAALSKAARFTWWYRLYLFAFGWLFFHLARDEYYGFHEFRLDVQLQYLLIGAAAALITLFIGWRKAGPKWHFLLVLGLALSAFGAFILAQFGHVCITLPGGGDCLRSFYFEETFEYLGIWLALVAVLGIFSAAIPRPTRAHQLFLYVFPLVAALFLLTPFLLNHIASRYMAEPIEIVYDADVTVQAYRIEKRAKTIDVQIFVSASSWRAYNKLGYSLHLVDQATGKSLAGADKAESRLHDWRIALYDTATRYSQWLSVDSSSIPANRALWAVLTLWRGQGDAFLRQKILSSELPTLGDTQVVLGELVLRADTPAAPSVKPLALFDGGYALGLVNMPKRAQAGETLEIAFVWSAEEKGAADYRQFLHIGQPHSGEWQIYDQLPLGENLPTRLWYAGLRDEATWQVTLSDDMAPGRYEVFTGLYRASDLARVPVTDAAGGGGGGDALA